MPNFVDRILKRDVVSVASPDASVLESDIKRLCMLHFTSAMLPELQKFRTHLKNQGVEIESRVERNEHYLRSRLLIEYPSSSVSILDISYHYSAQCLIITGQLAAKISEVAYKFSLADINEVTNVEAYEIIESFVTSVFNEFSLCEFVTEEEEEREDEEL